MIQLAETTQTTAGILLLAIVTIEFGGTFLLRIASGKVPMTDFQKSFARAGHAHAGVLVILSLVSLIYADALALDGIAGVLSFTAIPSSAIFISAGFFFCSMGKDRTTPNRWIALIWIGAASLATGVLTLGIALVAS